MELPRAVAYLVSALASPAGVPYDRHRITQVATSELQGLLALTAVEHGEWNRELAQIAVWRGFVATLPAAVFEYPDQPCRAQVTRRVEHLLGEAPDESFLDHLMMVVKRIQRYLISGRRAVGTTSFDVSLVSHSLQLRKQGWRCGVCGYQFRPQDLEPDASAGLRATTDEPIAGGEDRSPRRLRRRAVLDHILPVYLAGDDAANWQILCKTCNEGKSDLVVPVLGSEWAGSVRSGSLVATRARLFYMVLARDAGCTLCRRTPSQTELRLRRRDPEGTDTYVNLAACCKSSLSHGRC